MKQDKEANSHHLAPFTTVPRRGEVSELYTKYLALQSSGYPYMNKRLCLIARNVLYLGHLNGFKRRQLKHYIDLFRNKTKPSLMAIDNFIQSIGCSYDLVLNCDLITEAVESNLVAPGFNPNTYKLAFDLWNWEKPEKV